MTSKHFKYNLYK